MSEPIGSVVVERLEKFVGQLNAENKMDWDKVIQSLLKMIAEATCSTTAAEAASALEKVVNARATHSQNGGK